MMEFLLAKFLSPNCTKRIGKMTIFHAVGLELFWWARRFVAEEEC